MGNSSRNRPLEPPLSATVTIAVSSWVIWRSAVNVADKPCPPPSATTLGNFIHDLHRGGLGELRFQHQIH